MATIAGRPTSSYRLRAPTPAGGKRWRHAEQWLERPALVQFVYLSMLLHAIAILLFGAPAGGIREGRAMWGSLNVVLQGPARDVAIPPRMEPLPALPLPLPRLERELTRAPAPPRPVPAPAQKRTAPPVDVPIIVPPALQRISPPPLRLDKALPTPRIEVLPLPAEAPPVIVPAPLQPIVPDLPRVERAIAETPKITAPLAQPVAPPVKEPAIAPPAQVAPIETPTLPSLPAAPSLPSIERAPVIAAPPKETTPEPPAPPKVERAPEPPKVERPAPAREEATPRPSAFRAPSPAPAPVESRRDDPNYDPTRPAIDLDEARRRAAQMAREGTGQRALLPFPMPAPPQRKTKTEEALDKARKPDCRTAYKELGLAAVVPLIANEFGEGSCRW
jgi:hypothetical protein